MYTPVGYTFNSLWKVPFVLTLMLTPVSAPKHLELARKLLYQKMDSPRRSPRLAMKYSAASDTELFLRKEVQKDDGLCATTTVVVGVWALFFASLVYIISNMPDIDRDTFAWELSPPGWP
jgi:hypothetical protein